ncbi:alpha/beta fold hydrolase [Nocardioides cynanchi]|uniref:alpha/beta fold hydrolase n=1 Tax=Nocardioides cynanchi TaxID=2558918 RepID=UPI001244BEC4|nr:alpha/beta fold hydrolase [Nocardioides cynanchi]
MTRPVGEPTLTRYDVPGQTQALALVLHGGKDRSSAPVTGRSLSWRRARGLARALEQPLHDGGVGIWLLRYRTVGWNGDGADKVADARWALDRVLADVGEVPVVLVGHSMGGRTACQAADHRLVQGVVALAPWLPPDEPVDALTGRELHAAHGRRDHITKAGDTRAYVDRARAVAAAASFTDMGDRGHYLLRGVHAWNSFTLDRVRRIVTS